jgi:hypothetical protein
MTTILNVNNELDEESFFRKYGFDRSNANELIHAIRAEEKYPLAERAPLSDDFSGLPQRLSPADVLTLMSYTSNPQAEGRANAFRQMVGRSGTYRRSAPAGLQAALNSIAGTTDDEIQAESLRMLRQALNTPPGQPGHLPLGNIAAFNQWAASLPHHFIKDVRNAYTAMSTQAGQERVREIAEEKLPYEMRKLEHDESLFSGAETLQQLKIEKERLGIKQAETDLRQGDQRTRDDGDYTITEDWTVTPRYPNGRWSFKSKAPRWESNEGDIRELKKGDKFIVEIKRDGKWVEYNTADRWAPPTVPKEIKLVNEYIRLLEASGETVGPARRAEIFRDYGLVDQSVTRPAYTTAMITEYNNKKTAFSNSTDTIKRMLQQLSDPQVTVGNVRSLFSGIENIGSQFRQFAQQFKEDHLVDPRQYDFGTAELSGQLALNVTGLAYALAKQEEGNRLTDADVQKRIDMITGRAGGSPMSKDMMTANLIEIFNSSVRNMKNEYRNALDSELPGTSLYSTPGEFLDSREAES